MYKTFKEMPIWIQAMDIAVEIFKQTESLPRKEDYGYTSQIRRSALSISANIAEAFGRNHTQDKIKFYYIARGSLTETQSHLHYGDRVGYIPKENLKNLDELSSGLLEEINKVIVTLRDKSN